MHDSPGCGAILVVIDGCRPDGIQQAATPNIDALDARGAYTCAAQSVGPSSTLPCHTSMFRGVTPERHGITTNTDHGGHGKTHGTGMPEDLTIPWIAAGANIGHPGEIREPVRIFDTAPTLARVLELPLSEDWEGQPISQIF